MAQYRYERLQGEYARLWAQMRVVKTAAAIAQARRIIAAKPRYEAVAGLTGVPWFVVGCLHMRESDGNFETWLHNGDPMRRDDRPVQTVHVPKGRPPDPRVSWEEGAEDALAVCEHLDEVDRWCPERVAYAAEQYNGFGYRNPERNIPSPYLWGGTSVQKCGKFVRDFEYDSRVMDPQLGVMAVLKTLMEIDPEARFEAPADKPAPAPAAPQPAPEPAPREPPFSPKGDKGDKGGKADDTETEVKPLHRSRTIWGGITSFLATVVSTVAGFFDKLDNPYTLAAFVALLAFGGLAAWLVISGRINVQKVVAHLSEDDTDA
jgi:lysozyme family protein